MDNEKLVIQPKLRGEDGYKTFSVRLLRKTVDRLDGIAARSGYSRNELVGMFLAYALDHCVVEGGKE